MGENMPAGKTNKGKYTCFANFDMWLISKKIAEDKK
jgi:hypothetical protein